MQISFSRFNKTVFFSLLLSLTLLSWVSAAQQAQSIRVSVSVDPALADKINPEHTLFVYARAAQGPRMPLAIVKYRAGELPLETQLENGMAMMPQMSLSNFPQVVLLARISASGNAMPQAGDLMGETSVVEWQQLDKPVAITINKQR